MNTQPEIESRIRERLNEIKEAPARDLRAAARGRARFLAQVVAARETQRHPRWFPIFRQQQFAMNLVVALVVIVGLFVGGGTTVRAAQDQLPGEPLYGVKTFSEDISLQFENDPEVKVDRLMQLAQTRVKEMTRLVDSGQTPPEQVRQRLEQHLQQALQISSNMSDAELDQKLPQIRTQLQQQEQDLQLLRTHAGQETQPILEQTRTMVQAQLDVVNEGVQNHALFRSIIHSGLPLPNEPTQTSVAVPATSTPTAVQSEQVATPPDGLGNGNGNGVGPDADPGKSHPHMTITPNATTGPGNNGHGSGNNTGGNGQNNGKGPKDKDNGNNGSNKTSTKPPK